MSSEHIIKLTKDGSDLKLRPITPSHSVRYSKGAKANPKTRLISARLYSLAVHPEPQYLPPGWSTHIQPEGQLYFYNSASRVVTEACINRPEVLERVILWIHAIQAILLELRQPLPPYAELFLQLDGNDDSCGYYFVDHATQTEFWLKHVSSEDVDVPDSVSEAQLRYALTEHYWNHVEFFPMHGSYVTAAMARELASVLRHGRADNLTSSVSTFPFDAAQCGDFLQELRDGLPSDVQNNVVITDGYFVCFIARLWSQINRHRFLHYYGEENARLSRDQRMIEADPTTTPLVLKTCNKLLFNQPENYVHDLERLWVDDLVCIEPWKAFMLSCLAEWRDAVTWTLVVLLAHTMFRTSEIGSSLLATAAIAFTLCGLASGLALSHYHRMPMNLQACEAATFLTQVYHPSYGFQPLALVYSLPKGILFWSTALLGVQACIEILNSIEQNTAMVLLGCLGLIGCVVIAVLRRGNGACNEGYVDEDAAKRSFWRRVLCLSAKRSGSGEEAA